MKVLLIDDEPRAHKVLENYIERIPDLELAGNFFNAVTAAAFFETSKADLIFLDITMPEKNGFEFLRMLPQQPWTIITTAHPEFALQGYDYDAIDYLTKPISFERFLKAVNKVKSLHGNKTPAAPVENQIELKIEGEMMQFNFADILYFKSLGNYIQIFTRDKSYVTQIPTHHLEKKLPAENFIRIHKSFIVNKSCIQHISEDTVTIQGRSLAIGKTFKKYVQRAVESGH